MLYVPRQPLDHIDDLRTALQNALALEFSTIPPYLTALYSIRPIRPGVNAAAAAIIRSVVMEEMLHLSLVGNILNAVGGRPRLAATVPQYPGPLPMGIGDQPGHPFIVPLQRLSRDLVRDIFMVIEEPEHPLEFPDLHATLQPEEFHTIGEFYAAVAALLGELGPTVFTGHADRQVTGWIGPHEITRVTGPDSARDAITLIVDQGEGTATSPASGPESLAHYYRFEQIQMGETLTPDPGAGDGYAWGDPVIPLEEDGVWPMVDNPPLVPLPAGSAAADLADQFDGIYTVLVDELQATFDGRPQRLGSAVAQMHALRLQAQRMLPVPLPGDETQTIGPRFRYGHPAEPPSGG
ncbi:MAG TPA: ferritin-like protein [Microlunatus sp.]